MAMKNISLADIREAIENKYASTTVDLGDETIELQNVLRLSKEDRKKVLALQEELSSDFEGEKRDQEDVLSDIFRCICVTTGQANRLLRALGNELVLMVEIFQQYAEASQLGEASPSES
jgi:DNA-binding transcriptional MerR regulator